ncbi:MAG: prepilin-type N-terminal cleavage/methylation domain-containing protein [Elusimicrobiota bacterium]|jgi:prepilin-type N-terminal cleavage/methylation domain-containing protein|nr:prepilin-type N-terminal cleavage/methylation domain-containing protein [Elusimicrobiota bacterium]
MYGGSIISIRNKKAFTLIELLVVVLIIGILAAIALPRYFYAKEKTLLSQMAARKREIDEAVLRYHLVTGQYPESLDALDISLPANGKIIYWMTPPNPNGGYYKIISKSGMELESSFYIPTRKITTWCIAVNDIQQRLCKEFCSVSEAQRTGVGNGIIGLIGSYYQCNF